MKLNKPFISVAAILLLLLAGILSACVPPVPEVIEVTGVDITKEDQSMKVVETLQLAAVVTPEDATNKTITWESDNPDVATVSENGLVTALSAGTANITVTTEDGAFADTIKITVTAQLSGGGTSPAPKKHEVSFGVYLLPEESSAGLTSSRGEDPVPNLAGVEIEIFSDEARTDKVTTVTTDENGTATVKLPKGIYYFIASNEGYICGPFDELESIPEIITLPTPIATLAVQGTFTISNGDISDIIMIIAREAYVVTFLATENNTQPFGVSRKIDPSPIPDVTIEIYEASFINTSIIERTAKEPVDESKITTLTTDSSGIAQVYLPNGNYSFTASKEGYVYFPPEDTSSSVQRAIQKGYFEVVGADITDTDPIQVPMERVYTLTINTDPTDSGTVTDNTKTGPYTAGTEVIISAEAAEGYEFVSWSSTTGTFADVTSINTTFTMPAEDTTVTANFTPVYTVSIAEVVGGTATVTANPNTDILEGETVTVTISDIETDKTFISLKVVGNDSDIPQITTVVTEGEQYTFLMPDEDVTITVTIDDVCPQAGYIYNGSEYADNWMLEIYSDNTDYLIDGEEYLYLKAWIGDDDYQKLIGLFTTKTNRAYISDCINSIVVDWENTGSDSNTNESYLVVASSKDGFYTNYDNYDKGLLKQNNFGRTTDKLDVSELTSGSYYIGVIARVEPEGTDTDYSEIKVHSIELSQIK